MNDNIVAIALVLVVTRWLVVLKHRGMVHPQRPDAIGEQLSLRRSGWNGNVLTLRNVFQ